MRKPSPPNLPQAPDAPGAANLKHELRTPLNQIIGYCEMLIEEAQDYGLETALPDLERIHVAGRQLLGVIDALFEPAKAAAYHADPALLDHEIRTPLNQIIGYAEMLQEETHSAAQTSFVADLGKIHAAARQLLQRLIEHFGPDYGSFLLPQMRTSETTGFVRRHSAETTGVRPTKPVVDLSLPTGVILVVDDDPANRDMLARRLQRLGHQISLAENGRQALEIIRQRPFDLVLLDLQMPEMNGYQVLEQLKADPALCHLPVIVLSASDDTLRVAHCVEMGAEDYLPKPFEPILLQARIGACLEKKRLRDREVSYLRQIQQEKERSDELLHIILPHEVAEELKATSMVKPRRFDNVGVIFCDIVGFTAYCDQHPPEEVLDRLQALVESFEQIAARHELEKIKTIGDSFMATTRLLEPLPNPALACVRAGLEMIATSRLLPPHWDVRIGVHVGPVIAGIVGHRKYQYDVWGDTVNTAARLEEAAAPATICVNGQTWTALAEHCRGRSQGLSHVKGKGEFELFLVDALLPLPSS